MVTQRNSRYAGFRTAFNFPVSADSRGRAYVRAGRVGRISAVQSDAGRCFRLDGNVTGTAAAPYSTTAVVIAASGGEPWKVFEGRCSCPVRTNCKHAVALAYGWLVEQGHVAPPRAQRDPAGPPRPRRQVFDYEARMTDGAVQEFEFPFTIDDLLEEVSYSVAARLLVDCRNCRGSGESSFNPCDDCGGTGEWNGRGGFPGSWRQGMVCRSCDDGVRYTDWTSECGVCRGSGRTRKTVTGEVVIPPCARDGARTTFTDASGTGTAAGAVQVVLREQPHRRLTRRGDADLVLTRAVPPSGRCFKVRLGDGEASLKLPGDALRGRVYRFRGLGLPTGHGSRGNLLVTVS